jgi:hypothetical protein
VLESTAARLLECNSAAIKYYFEFIIMIECINCYLPHLPPFCRNPTQEPDPLLQNIVWAPVTHSDFRYLSIGTDLALRHNFNKDRMDFWEALLQYNNTDS